RTARRARGRGPTGGGTNRARQRPAQGRHGGGPDRARGRPRHVSLWQGILLGLVQGLTEFLPVSSSGHLVLVEALTGVHFTDVTVEVSLHVATLGSLLLLYGARLSRVARAPMRR